MDSPCNNRQKGNLQSLDHDGLDLMEINEVSNGFETFIFDGAHAVIFFFSLVLRLVLESVVKYWKRGSVRWIFEKTAPPSLEAINVEDFDANCDGHVTVIHYTLHAIYITFGGSSLRATEKLKRTGRWLQVEEIERQQALVVRQITDNLAHLEMIWTKNSNSLSSTSSMLHQQTRCCLKNRRRYKMYFKKLCNRTFRSTLLLSTRL